MPELAQIFKAVETLLIEYQRLGILPDLKSIFDRAGIVNWKTYSLLAGNPHFAVVRTELKELLGNKPADNVIYDLLVQIPVPKPVPAPKPAHVAYLYTAEKHAQWLRNVVRPHVGEDNWAVLEPKLFAADHSSLLAPPCPLHHVKLAWKCPFCALDLRFSLQSGHPHLTNFLKHIWSHLTPNENTPKKKRRSASDRDDSSQVS